jgi:hypothetical protein
LKTTPRQALEGATNQASHSRFSGQRHVVSGAPVWRRKSSGERGSTLAGNRDVFTATGMVTVLARLGNRAGDFIGVDAPIGCGLGEFPRLAVGARGVSAAFLTPRQALVDAIAIRLVGDDEDAAVGRCSRRGRYENAGQKDG